MTVLHGGQGFTTGCHAERSGEERNGSPRSRSIATPFRLHPRVLHPAMPEVGMLRLRHRIAARSSGSAQHDIGLHDEVVMLSEVVRSKATHHAAEASLLHSDFIHGY